MGHRSTIIAAGLLVACVALTGCENCPLCNCGKSSTTTNGTPVAKTATSGQTSGAYATTGTYSSQPGSTPGGSDPHANGGTWYNPPAGGNVTPAGGMNAGTSSTTQAAGWSNPQQSQTRPLAITGDASVSRPTMPSSTPTTPTTPTMPTTPSPTFTSSSSTPTTPSPTFTGSSASPAAGTGNGYGSAASTTPSGSGSSWPSNDTSTVRTTASPAVTPTVTGTGTSSGSVYTVPGSTGMGTTPTPVGDGPTMPLSH